MSQTSVYSTARTRYRLVAPIAESHTATVWRGRDEVAQRDVAVKRLRDADDPVARRRLEDEATANDRVTHPGAVPLLDKWFNEDDAVLVFEYVPGTTLAQRLHDQPRLEPREATRIAIELADVLAATHAAGLVHRDVKPANVLIGDDGHARLVDYGISVAGDRKPEALELTGSGQAIGTLPYMAPEQLTGAPATSAVDIYALGVVLYEMLTGERPFNGGSPSEQLQLQQHAPREMSAVPPALATLTIDALDPVPGRRPTAAQLGRALTAWLEGRSETEAPTQQVPVAALAGVAAVGSAAAPAADGARPAVAAPVDQSRRRRALNAAAFVAVSLAVAALAALLLGANLSPAGTSGLPTAPAAALVAPASPTAPPASTTPAPATKPPAAAITGAGDSPPAVATPPSQPPAAGHGPGHHGPKHHGHHKHHHKHKHHHH